MNPPSFYVMKQISTFNPMVCVEIISKVETGFLWKSDPGPLPKPHHCAQRWWHSQPAATPTQAGRKISRDVPALLLNLSLGELKKKKKVYLKLVSCHLLFRQTEASIQKPAVS